MATTAAGDRVWVVDANKTVYVYDRHGRTYAAQGDSAAVAEERARIVRLGFQDRTAFVEGSEPGGVARGALPAWIASALDALPDLEGRAARQQAFDAMQAAVPLEVRNPMNVAEAIEKAERLLRYETGKFLDAYIVTTEDFAAPSLLEDLAGPGGAVGCDHDRSLGKASRYAGPDHRYAATGSGSEPARPDLERSR